MNSLMVLDSRNYSVSVWKYNFSKCPSDSTALLDKWFFKRYAVAFNIVVISSFVSENREYQIDPPIKFESTFDPATQMFEITGETPYQNILVYGKTVNEASDILRTEIIPLMWEKYVNDNDSKLSANARKIKNDLENRVVR